ncbi:acriflavin resistance protein, partial [Pseudomonas amygdali pv. mori str. 301020]
MVNVALYVVVPKTFLPQQDTGQLMGFDWSGFRRHRR